MVFRRAGERALLCFFACLPAAGPIFGCGDDRALTELVVVVDTDFEVPGALDEIALTVEGASGMQYPVVAEFGAEGSPTLPLFTFLEPAGEALGPITVTVTGRLGAADIIERRARTHFLPGESRTLFISLLRSCQNVACETEMTCADGACRSVDVPPESLPPWTGSLAMPGAIDGGPDAMADAMADAGPGAGDAGLCVPAVEVCNDLDDDCDGSSDEDFDLGTDSAHCGACGNVCEDRPHSSALCERGSCILACDPGRGDCNAVDDDGCETDISTPGNCGACDHACTAEAPLCDSAEGCVSSCVGATARCGLACVDTDVDVNHCGRCGTRCVGPPRSAPTCTAGACGFLCDAGFGDCDGAVGTGCEERLNSVGHCGGCDVPCVVTNGLGTCATGACAVGTCLTGFADCDGSGANGCEAAVGTVYRDSDGDGYGDPTVPATRGCATMPGWVADGTDCDDSDAVVRPGAREFCNLRDDDCNALADDGLAGCGESCATPMVVYASTSFPGQVTCAAADNGNAACDVEPGEPDHVYLLIIDTATDVAIALSGGGEATLWVESTCDDDVPPAFCALAETSSTVPLTPGTYFLHVEFGHSPCGRPYTLDIDYRSAR